MKGKYPKGFKFVGWHPHCRCQAIPLLKTEEEMQANTQRILNGEEPVEKSENDVENLPQGFTDWVENNKERIENAKTLPYFLRDNAESLPYFLKDNLFYTHYTGMKADKRGFRIYTGDKLGRTATKEAYKVYKDAPVTILSDKQRENIADIAKEMGVEAKPMTFFEADNGNGNIDFKQDTPTSDNCQTCVLVHEARLRGLPITSKPYQSDVQYILGNNSGYGWINPKTGETPTVKPFTERTPEALLQKLDERTLLVGRYHIGINIDANNGHIITAERFKNGEIYFYDPQDNSFVNIKEYASAESFEVLKVDKLLLRKDVIISISRLL